MKGQIGGLADVHAPETVTLDLKRNEQALQNGDGGDPKATG